MTVAVGDVNNDGRADVVTKAGPTGGPRMRVQRASGPNAGEDFFAFVP